MSTTTTARAARPPHSLLLLLMLGLSAMAPVAPGGKRFDGLTTCAACVDAGFGWSLKKSKCGMFANRDCGGSTAADSSGASAPAAASGGAPAPPPPRSYLGELPIVGTVPRMKWDLSDPNFATTLARRRTPVVLTDSPASAAWRGFDRWAEPGYLEQQLTEPLNFAKSYDPNFMYYNKRHGWAEEARRIKAAPAQRLGAAKCRLAPIPLFVSSSVSLSLSLRLSLCVRVFVASLLVRHLPELSMCC
jgi:hypothetical protein